MPLRNQLFTPPLAVPLAWEAAGAVPGASRGMA